MAFPTPRPGAPSHPSEAILLPAEGPFLGLARWHVRPTSHALRATVQRVLRLQGLGPMDAASPRMTGPPCDSSDRTRLRPGSPACGLLGASAVILGFQEFYVFTENTSKSKTAVCPPSYLTEAGNVSAGEGLATAGPASHPSTLPRGRRSRPRPARCRLRTFRRNPPRSTEAACVLAGSCGSHGEPHSRFPGTEQRPPGQTRKPRGSSGASCGAAVVP